MMLTEEIIQNHVVERESSVKVNQNVILINYVYMPSGRGL